MYQMYQCRQRSLPVAGLCYTFAELKERKRLQLIFVSLTILRNYEPMLTGGADFCR